MVISKEKGGFVERSNFLDRVVIDSNAIHSMETSSNKAMFIKRDMGKACDQVKWSFHKNVFLEFDFVMK